MASHEKRWTMAVEAIDEYLTAASICLNYSKPDGFRLGYPTVLLLLCVVNALGTYLVGDEVVIDGKILKITKGEPFRVLNHACFGFQLGGNDIKFLERSYRNRLAHNAIIEPGSFMTELDEDPPFVFELRRGVVALGIRVFPFYRRVQAAWKRFPVARIQEWEARQAFSKKPTTR